MQIDFQRAIKFYCRVKSTQILLEIQRIYKYNEQVDDMMKKISRFFLILQSQPSLGFNRRRCRYVKKIVDFKILGEEKKYLSLRKKNIKKIRHQFAQ